MKTSLFRSSATLFVVVLLLMAAAPAQAGNGSKNSPAQTQTFTVTTGTPISMAGSKSITLEDIKAGDHVSIAYTDASGVLTTSRIKDLGTNPAKRGKSAAKTGHKSHAATGLHAHGIVQNVNVADQTLTISVRQHHVS